MERTPTFSLRCAMREILQKRILNSLDSMALANIAVYKRDKFLSENIWRIRISYWWNGRERHSSLMKVDANCKTSFFEVKMNMLWDDSWNRQFRNISPENCMLIYDEICKTSDAGFSLAFYITEICAKKERVNIINPFEGASLQIEADMLQPEFAEYDSYQFCRL